MFKFFQHASPSPDANEVTFTGRLVITVHEARNLHDVAVIQSMSPFVKIAIGEIETAKTVVIDNAGTSAVWNEAVLLDVHSHKGTDLVRMVVFDKGLIHDDKIGEFSLQLQKLIKYAGTPRWVELVDLSEMKLRGELKITIEWKGTPAAAALSSPSPEPAANTNNTTLQNPTALSSASTPTFDPSTAFYVVHNGFALAPLGAAAHEVPLRWTRFSIKPSFLFAFDSAAHLRHVDSGLCVQPSLGVLVEGQPLCLVNGIGENGKFWHNNVGLIHTASQLSVGGVLSQGQPLIGEAQPAVITSATVQLTVQPVHKPATSTPIAAPSTNPVFWLRHNGTRQYAYYNKAEQRLELGETKEHWNHTHAAFQFDAQDRLFLPSSQKYVQPTSVHFLTLTDNASEECEFAFQNGSIIHKKSKLAINLARNAILWLNEATTEKWSLDLGQIDSQKP
jgi:hypothetical protein